MAVPEKVYFDNEEEYKQHYHSKYCESGIVTHDGIPIRFALSRFEHAFYERSSSDRRTPKDTFCLPRAKRIDWIEEALTNPAYTMYEGWLKYKEVYTSERRITLVDDGYLVMIDLFKKKDTLRGEFITAYSPLRRTLKNIKSGPKWTEYKKGR